MQRRRRARGLRPMAERLDGRALLSILPVLVHSQPQIHIAAGGAAGGGGGSSAGQNGGSSSGVGLPGITTSTAPMSPRELQRSTFLASLRGPYSVSAGRFADQARQIYIKANGSSTFTSGAKLQMGLFTPADPTTGTTVGTLSFQDRSVSTTGNILILDLTGTPGSIDSLGRPTEFTWTVDASSGGEFTNAAGSGTMDIRYDTGGSVRHDAVHAGLAYIHISGQVVTTGANDVLRVT